VCWGESVKTRAATKKPDQPAKPEDGAGDDDPVLDADPFADRDPDADADAASAPDPVAEAASDTGAPVTEERSFRGNDTCDRVLERFTPMKALRKFEGLDEAKLEEMGLTAPESSLTVTTDKGERTFDVGERSYGNNDYYVIERATQTVYLIESRMIGDLKGGHTRLMQRDLQTFEKAEVETAVVASGQVVREFTQVNRDDKANAYWADSADQTRTNDAADAWLDKAFRLRALEYYPDSPTALQPAFRIVLLDAGKEIGSMELGTARDADGEEIYVARTANTVAWVKVSDTTASRMIEDLAGVLATGAAE
jgi:hypothetical protein